MTDATKRALADSLRKLLLEKPLPKITIGEVSTGAGVNRQTFYYHFNDIVDLLLYGSGLIGEGLIADPSFGFDFENDFSRLLLYFKENRPVINNVYPYLGKEAAETLFEGISHEFVLHYVKKAALGVDSKDDDIKKVSAFYGYAIKGILYDYISGGFSINIQDISHCISSILLGSLRNSLINLANDRLAR